MHVRHAAGLALPKTPLTINRNPKFTPHSSLTPLGSFHPTQISLVTERRLMRKPHAYYNIKAWLDKDDSVCVNGSAVTSPHVGRLSPRPECRFCGWTWLLTSFVSFLHDEPNISRAPALRGIIIRCCISEDAPIRFASLTQKSLRLQHSRSFLHLSHDSKATSLERFVTAVWTR